MFSSIYGDSSDKAEIYYTTANYDLKAQKTTIADDISREEAAMQLLNSMKEPSPKDGMVTVVPDDLEFLSVQIEDTTARVNISGSYFEMKNSQEVLCRSALVWTLTSLDFVEHVELSVEGVPLRNEEGDLVGPMDRQNVLLNPEISSDATEYAILKLYFANGDGTDLVVEDRVVEVSANQAREKTIMEQLIAGPLENGSFATIPADTKLRDITTTSDGICYVNLSQEFLTKPSNVNEILTIYSVVNSLCELDQIDRVQFLIEGEKVENFRGRSDFGTPYTAVESLKTVMVDKIS
nr:GerMN domain-containing protein [Anaerotignum lactatifermentans]